jgi:hypothetical protein
MKRRFGAAPLVVLVLAGLLVLLARPVTAAEKDYWAEQFDTEITVEEGGSLLVRETVTYYFVGEPYTYIFREVPTDHTDGVTILEARLDGERLPAGTAAGHVEIAGRDPIRVTWHMAPTVNRSRTVELVYRMAGVVRQGEGSDLLRYQILPDEYDFFVESGNHVLSYPGAATLIGQPRVTAGQATLTVSGQEVEIAGTGYEANDPLVVELSFRPGSIITEPPAWQARQQAQRSLSPWWLVLGVSIMLAGAAGLIYFWQRYQPTPRGRSAGKVYEPPTDLAPALAGMLTNSGLGPGWPQALATLFSLADRGILTIAERAAEKWYRSRDFVVELAQEPPADLLPHEARLLELLFETKKGPTGSVTMSELGGRISSRQWKAFVEAQQAELKGAGLIDQGRQQAKRRLNIAGLLLLFASLGGILLVIPWGPWALAVPFSLFAVSVAALIGAGAYRPLSEEGAQLADRWQRFRAYLEAISRGKAATTRPDLFERYLAYAAGFDLLSRWAKHYEKEADTTIPTWFHAASAASADHMAAFVALSASASSSGGSAAGAAGAGAAGGGAAGAG